MPQRKRASAKRLSQATRRLWTCPKCGRQFKMTKAYHSCDLFPLEYHFDGKPVEVRALYDRLIEAMQRFGPLTVYPTKSRIVFQADTQFAVVVTRKSGLELSFWLQRRADHPLLHKFQMGVYRDYGHIFNLTHPRDLDDDLISLLQEAYLLDIQSPLVPH
jgi:hypothetical protein